MDCIAPDTHTQTTSWTVSHLSPETAVIRKCHYNGRFSSEKWPGVRTDVSRSLSASTTAGTAGVRYQNGVRLADECPHIAQEMALVNIVCRRALVAALLAVDAAGETEPPFVLLSVKSKSACAHLQMGRKSKPANRVGCVAGTSGPAVPGRPAKESQVTKVVSSTNRVAPEACG